MNQLFFNNPAVFTFNRFVSHAVIGSVLLFCTFKANAQSNDLIYTAVDSSFTMQVDREKTDVKITLTFNDSLTFDYVAIERKADNPEFSQCKYISYEELKTGNRHLVEKDMYPYAGSTDVLYRLKLVTKEGIVRTFPPITLYAVKK